MDLLDGPQSALAPAGPEAAGIARIAWLMFGGATAIFVLVLVLAAIAVWRSPRWLAGRSTVVVGGFVFPLVVLSALLVDSLLSAPRSFASMAPPELVVEIVGEQWWWRVVYLDERGEPDFATANELHVPVGAAVELRLRSADVLHSFWVPPLAGKLDMIPGRTNRLVVVADREGAWRGQCAEYCGTAHAQMALHVIAQPPEGFARWRDGQRAEAAPGGEEVVSGGEGAAADGEGADGESVRGRALFEGHCAVCHTVRGTAAAGVRGPDLTHLASRVSLGGGILPNDPATLERWIASSQRLKPGNLMPEFDQLAREDLRALSAYLAGLD